MTCLECKKDLPDVLRFRVLEVHTLHIRDFDGERVIQALGEFQEYDVCTACASEEVQALLLPAKRIMMRCLPFALLVVVGIALSLLLTFRDIMPALRVIGPMAIVVGIIGIAGKVREILSEREAVSKMSRDDAVRYCAWQLVLRNAPKKYGDNDVTYIPVNDDTMRMSARELAENYGLIPAIANQVHLAFSQEVSVLCFKRKVHSE